MDAKDLVLAATRPNGVVPVSAEATLALVSEINALRGSLENRNSDIIRLIDQALDHRINDQESGDWCPCCEYCGVWPPSEHVRSGFRRFLATALTVGGQKC